MQWTFLNVIRRTFSFASLKSFQPQPSKWEHKETTRPNQVILPKNYNQDLSRNPHCSEVMTFQMALLNSPYVTLAVLILIDQWVVSSNCNLVQSQTEVYGNKNSNKHHMFNAAQTFILLLNKYTENFHFKKKKKTEKTTSKKWQIKIFTVPQHNCSVSVCASWVWVFGILFLFSTQIK